MTYIKLSPQSREWTYPSPIEVCVLFESFPTTALHHICTEFLLSLCQKLCGHMYGSISGNYTVSLIYFSIIYTSTTVSWILHLYNKIWSQVMAIFLLYSSLSKLLWFSNFHINSRISLLISTIKPSGIWNVIALSL